MSGDWYVAISGQIMVLAMLVFVVPSAWGTTMGWLILAGSIGLQIGLIIYAMRLYRREKGAKKS